MALADDCADTNAVDFSYPFLSGIDPANPPSRITIPSKYLDAMASMERQYWEIKAERYNVVIFFKKGKFYEVYDYDAVIANKEFGLKMVFDTTNRGKMRLAGVPEQSLSEWARLFVFRGYKVGRVEQMVKGAEDDSPGGGRAKIVPRELVEVLTPGTLTDAAMLSDHNEVFLLALAPQPADGVVDAFAVDLSRHVVHWCPCGEAAAVRRYCERHSGKPAHSMTGIKKENEEEGERNGAAAWTESAMRSVTALLQQLHPREVVVPAANSTSKADVLCADYLTKWVQADGFVVEQVLVPTAAQPSALETVSAYLRSLKLERVLPLLDQAELYQSHIVSSSSSQRLPSGEVDVGQTSVTEMPSKALGVLEWERRYGEGLVLDSATVSNLEIVTNLLDGSEKQSLHHCLNHCITNGGKRLFRAWLLRPSASARVIRSRQEAVQFLLACGLTGHNELWGRTEGSSDSASPSVACTPEVLSVSSGEQNPSLSAPATGAAPHIGWGKRPRDGGDDDGVTVRSSPSPASLTQSSSRSSNNGNAHFHASFANMLAVDFERSLSRLAEIKNDNQHQTISYVDPLIKYHKNLAIIMSSVQAFGEMVKWATQFHAMCRRYCSQQHQQSGSSSSSGGTRSAPLSGISSPAAPATTGIPALLEELLFSVEAAADSVTAMESLFDRRVAAETGLLTPAPGTSPTYDSAVERLATIEAKLHAYRRRAQEDVFHGATVNFVDVGKDLFLLEVAPSAAPKKTPPGMVERARSGKSVKYVVDALGELVESHKEATAAKSAALLTVLQSVAGKMCDHCPVLYAATSALSYLDCLINLARHTSRFPNMTLPSIANDGTEAFIEAEGLVHPLLTHLPGGSSAPVPNSVSLDEKAGRLLVLTGPNMAGKSTLMRTVAVSVIMAQLGGPVLAARMHLSPATRIFTRIGARDATQKGQSTLYVELSETAEILRGANGRSLCLIDELGRGTSTHDGLAIAHATLQALKGTATPPLTIFSTHYHSLALEQARCDAGRGGAVQLGYMDFALSGGSVAAGHGSGGDDNGILFGSLGDAPHADTALPTSAESRRAAAVPSIAFLYRLVPGICDRSYGVEVALMAGVNPALVAVARDKSAELARLTALHEDLETVRAFILHNAPNSGS